MTLEAEKEVENQANSKRMSDVLNHDNEYRYFQRQRNSFPVPPP